MAVNRLPARSPGRRCRGIGSAHCGGAADDELRLEDRLLRDEPELLALLEEHADLRAPDRGARLADRRDRHGGGRGGVVEADEAISSRDQHSPVDEDE